MPIECHEAPTEEELTYKMLVRNTMHRNNFCVEDYISVGLAGKIKAIEAKLVAIEVGYLINSAAYENGPTIEERAINRETGLRLAECLSELFFDDLSEADRFIRGVETFVEEDIMLEKSKYFMESQVNSTYRPIPIAGIYGYKDYLWLDETIAAIEANEECVSEIINNAADSLTDEMVAEKLEQFLRKFNLLQVTMTHNVLDDINRVVAIHKKLHA